MSSPHYQFDTIVVGGGAAGLGAAVAAARAGAKTALIERYGFVGGLATSAHVGTVCGLYTTGSGHSGYAGEFALEFEERLFRLSSQRKCLLKNGLCFLPYQSYLFEEVSRSFLEDLGIKVFLHATCHGVSATSVIEAAQVLLWNESASFVADSWVDASGEAVLSRFSGAELIEDNHYQAPGYVFSVSGIEQIESEQELALLILKELLTAVREGSLPEEMSRFSVVPGSFFNGSANLKFAFPYTRVGTLNELSEMECFGRKACTEAFRLLKGLWKNLHFSMIASQVGIRSGARALGKYVLTAEDVLSCRKFTRAAANGLWPIEYWGEKQKPELKFFSRDDYYQIPESCLISASFGNLFFAGRGISASAEALSSARVIGTSLATGYGAGRLAAQI